MSYSNYGRPSAFGRKKSSYSYPRTSGGRGPKKDYINPDRFIKAAKPVEQEQYVPTHAFADFEVDQLIKTNLTANGFMVPSPIQDQTIPAGLQGKDIVGMANTGTGKTAAFAVPLLHQLITDQTKAPTRELAQQIEDECRLIAKGSGLYGALLIGGVAMGPQLRDLRANPRIVVGTPGRIKDHATQGTLDLSKFNIVVLDEVDRMLDMGFINDITHILNKTASQRQSLFFSATHDGKVKIIIDTFATDPIEVSVKTGDTSDNVEQNIVHYGGTQEKLSKLYEVLAQDHVVKTLVFDDTHRSVEKLTKELQLRGFNTDAIHGGKSQSQRQKALNRFKNSEVDVLVATDVAARGIDVSDITHVINYSTPNTYTDYTHRIGRAGRAGKQGFALTFIER